MIKLICTTYNKQADGTLQLRNNWVEDIISDTHLEDFLDNWNVTDNVLRSFYKFQKNNTISDIGEGTSNYMDVIIHVRLIKF